MKSNKHEITKVVALIKVIQIEYLIVMFIFQSVICMHPIHFTVLSMSKDSIKLKCSI